MSEQGPQENLQPQSAPQYGVQNTEPYRNASPAYVSHAPSGMQVVPSEPAMMVALGPGPYGLHRGQRRPNPCFCCKGCCGGTCSLKTGVIIIGIINIVIELLALFTPSLLYKVWAINLFLGTFVLLKKINYKHVPNQNELWLGESIIFWVCPGIIMLIGALCLEPWSCIISGVLTLIGGVFHLGFYMCVGSMFVLYSITLIGVFVNCYAVLGCALRIYFGYCAYCLGKQIRHGEYKIP